MMYKLLYATEACTNSLFSGPLPFRKTKPSLACV